MATPATRVIAKFRRNICRGGPPWPPLRRGLVKESGVRIKLRIRNIPFPHRIHCDVFQVFLEVEIVSNNVVPKATLPKMFLEELFRLHPWPVL